MAALLLSVQWVFDDFVMLQFSRACCCKNSKFLVTINSTWRGVVKATHVYLQCLLWTSYARTQTCASSKQVSVLCVHWGFLYTDTYQCHTWHRPEGVLQLDVCVCVCELRVTVSSSPFVGCSCFISSLSTHQQPCPKGSMYNPSTGSDTHPDPDSPRREKRLSSSSLPQWLPVCLGRGDWHMQTRNHTPMLSSSSLPQWLPVWIIRLGAGWLTHADQEPYTYAQFKQPATVTASVDYKAWGGAGWLTHADQEPQVTGG